MTIKMRFNKNYIKILKYLKKNKYKFIPAYKWENSKIKKIIILSTIDLRLIMHRNI